MATSLAWSSGLLGSLARSLTSLAVKIRSSKIPALILGNSASLANSTTVFKGEISSSLATKIAVGPCKTSLRS